MGADVVLGLDVLGVVVVVAVLAVVVLVVRRRLLQRTGGTFDLSLRLDPGKRFGKGWMLGLGRYEGDDLEWYRAFSYSPRPKHVYLRRDLEVRSQRKPEGPEVYSLLSGSVVVACDVPGKPIELAMGESELMGFLSWLESAPPGPRFVR